LAVADINNDGALAVLISNLDGSPHPAAQRLEAARPLDKPEVDWNAIEPRRLRRSCRNCCQGLKQVDEVRANSSYLSASDARLHFVPWVGRRASIKS